MSERTVSVLALGIVLGTLVIRGLRLEHQVEVMETKQAQMADRMNLIETERLETWTRDDRMQTEIETLADMMLSRRSK